ncbi:MAG: TonB-dependent receptor domain-containing protein [Chitinophagia bacterium]
MKYFLPLFFLFASVELFAQNGTIRGQVTDANSGLSMGLASVQIFKDGAKEPVGGGLTRDNGKFEFKVPIGDLNVVIEFLGYKRFQKKAILTAASPTIDLGSIRLEPTERTLQEVVVQAEKSFMQLSLDKKIFNVGKDLANAGGSASNILQNIPSVSVDADGNVKLRGSDNVRILVDGKPSGLVSIKGGSGLQNLQASLVERVEIITNPSARYEAEGMAGIINIVLKKDRRQGFNGSVELITGNPDNFGLATNLNYRKKNINFFLNYGVVYRKQPAKGELTQTLFGKDTTFYFRQNDNVNFVGYNNNIRGGLDYFFSEKSILTAAYLYRRSQGNRLRNFLYNDYLFNLNNKVGYVKRTQDEDETEPNTEVTLNYKRSFAQKGHELTGEIKYLDYWENSSQLYTQFGFKPDGSDNPAKTLLQTSVNDEYERQWLFQLDYAKPIGKEGKFETGLRSSFRNMVNDYIVEQKNTSGGFDPLPGLDNVFVYDENIHGVYGILGNKTGDLQYQAGVRAEWTDVTTTLRETNQRNPRDYINLFPSVHVTYSLPQENGLQVSYSKRVRRPFYNDLSPYATFSDSRNFNAGNPDLNPEFSNVFELGHIKSFDKGSFTSSIYYRSTTGKIDRIRKVDEKGNAITRVENLLGEKAYGIEFTSGYSVFKWWKMDLNFNFFHANVDGSNILPLYKTATYSWFARQTSRFTPKKGIDIQWRMNYEAPQKLVQGRRKGIFYADLSFSKDIFKEKGSLNLNILDVFHTRKMRYTVAGPNFLTEAYSSFRPTQINLTFAYRIRQAKGTKSVKIIQD